MNQVDSKSASLLYQPSGRKLAERRLRLFLTSAATFTGFVVIALGITTPAQASYALPPGVPLHIPTPSAEQQEAVRRLKRVTFQTNCALSGGGDATACELMGAPDGTLDRVTMPSIRFLSPIPLDSGD